MEYITIKEAAEKWKISVRQVQMLCKNGKISGSVKWERSWMIPHNAEKPADGRTKNVKGKDTAMKISLPCQCPIPPLTDLYTESGEIKKSSHSMKIQPEAVTLLKLWISYSCGEISVILNNAKEFMDIPLDFNASISVAMLLSLCAMWHGDLKLWRTAKKLLHKISFENDKEYETLRFWIASMNSAMYDVSEFPDWFTVGRFYPYLHEESLQAAYFFYAKYHFIAANGLALKRFSIDGITGLGLMKIYPSIVEPIISNAAARKNTILEIYLRLLCAAAYHNIGNNADAIYHIDAALALALRGGFYGILAEHARLLDALLYDRLALVDPTKVKKLKEMNKKMMAGYTKLHNALYKSSITTVFSQRELEVARLAAFGLPDKEIASRLHLAVSSVKSIVAMAKNKVGADSRKDLGAYI